VLLEFHHVGDYVRVAAIDPVTNTEVSVVGSPQVTQEDLTRLAVRKLNYVLKRNQKPPPENPMTALQMAGFSSDGPLWPPAPYCVYFLFLLPFGRPRFLPVLFWPRPIFLANSERFLA